MKTVQAVKKNTKRQVLQQKSARARKRRVFLSHNFSDVEDGKDAYKTIFSIAQLAGKNAATEAKAKGLSCTYIRHYKILVQVSPAGAEAAVTPKIKRKTYYIKYKPHTVLHAVKK